MLIEYQESSRLTAVPDVFIDEYMGPANGEYVKVYLCLLRLTHKDGGEVSLSGMADRLDLTEKDVRRALKYWEKQRLLCLDMEGDDIRALRFAAFPQEAPDQPRGEEPVLPAAAAEEEVPEEVLQESFDVTQDVLTKLNGNSEFGELVFVMEKYLKHPLDPNDVRLLAYVHEGLRFSQELALYLLEYCAEIGHLDYRYIEKVAIGWHRDGIETVEQAKEGQRIYSRENREVMKAFGITGRVLGADERRDVERWRREYKLPLEVIVEGCCATMRAIHQPSFEYAEKILKGWSEAGVTTVADAQAQQELRKINRKKQNAKETPAPLRRRKTASAYDQRDVDYDAMLAEGKWY